MVGQLEGLMDQRKHTLERDGWTWKHRFFLRTCLSNIWVKCRRPESDSGIPNTPYYLYYHFCPPTTFPVITFRRWRASENDWLCCLKTDWNDINGRQRTSDAERYPCSALYNYALMGWSRTPALKAKKLVCLFRPQWYSGFLLEEQSLCA